MSVIQTIRNKYGKIAGAVIAIALVGFIVSDARNGSFGRFFGGPDNSVMKVDGEKISTKDLQARVHEMEIISGKSKNIDDATRAQIQEQAIQSLVIETAINKQCDKLGITTSDEEKKELIYGANPAPEIRDFQLEGRPIFINPQTGQFDPSIVKYLEKELQTEPDKLPEPDKLRDQWETIKNYVIRRNRINKFFALYAGSYYVPTYIEKRAFADQNSIASIRYVKVPYTAIPDNEVKVTDEDLNAYMKKHPGIFQVDEPSRTIEYVSFDIVPSSSDTARALGALTDIKSEFASAKNNETFVNNKSDETNSYIDGLYLNKRTLTSRYADSIMDMPVGGVYGPYYEAGAYRLSKVVDKKTYPDSVKCRYIVIGTRNKTSEILNDTAAKERIDTIMASLKNGVSFDTLVNKYSDDDKSKGGVNNFSLQQKIGLPKDLGNFIFEGKPGETKVVHDSNENFSAYFYVEIMDQKNIGPAVELASIAKNLTPSDSTVNAIYAKANEFAGKNTTAEAFDAAANKIPQGKRIGDNIKSENFTISGLGPAREIVKWAFDHKPGEVSSVFQLGDQRYVVAKVESVQDKGALTITPTIRPVLEQRVREEMKADLINKKYKGSASLDAIAAATSRQVESSDSVMILSPYIKGIGYEPLIAGYAFSNTLQPNTVSQGVKTQGGVYFITVVNRTTPPALDMTNPNFMQMLTSQRMMQEYQQRNAMGQSLMQSLLKESDVTYNYANF